MTEPFELKITKKDNGYSLMGTEIDMVFQENESDPLVAELEMLYAVVEYFGFYGSKHDKERIRIEIIKEGSDGKRKIQ